MPLDPQVAAFYARKRQLENQAKCDGPLTVAQMRENADATFNDKITRTDIYRTEERWIPGFGSLQATATDSETSVGFSETSTGFCGEALAVSAKTPSIPLRLYWPEEAASLPILLYFHGGGFVIHNLASHDSLCRMLAKAGNCLVISVGYRLAPEHPYPAAVEDAFAALCWIRNQAEEIGGDPRKIYVGGDSAGATISAALSLMARDRGISAIQGQLLFYGSYDCLSLDESESVRLYGNGEYVLPRPMIELFEKLYTPDGTKPDDPYRYPGKARDLFGLPRTFSVTGECDPLRDDGEAFARKLTEAGNEVTELLAPGMMHGFLLYWYEFDRAQEVIAEAGRFIRG